MRSDTRLRNVWRWIAVSMPLLVTAFVGCGKSQYPLVELTGKVTFDGGECPATGSVTLQPLEVPGKLPNRPATGQFGRDGEYAVNTFNDSRGVLPGRYRIEVTCYSGAPDASKPDPWADVSYIADEYEPTEIVIEADSPRMTFNIDVPRRQR